MPTSKNRRRLEIDATLYEQLGALATREGYRINRFADKLLYLAVQDYVKARHQGRYPFADLPEQQAVQST